MTSLLPEGVVSALRQSLGNRFDSLDQLERVAVVTAKAEGCVTHRRLTELSKEHPSELTRVLHGLVDKEIFKTDGGGKGTFYYLEGEHPIQGGIIQGFASADKDSEHLIQSSEHLDKSSEHLIQNSEHYPHLRQIAMPVKSSKKIDKRVVRHKTEICCS
jgi:hypothetical protein